MVSCFHFIHDRGNQSSFDNIFIQFTVKRKNVKGNTPNVHLYLGVLNERFCLGNDLLQFNQNFTNRLVHCLIL